MQRSKALVILTRQIFYFCPYKGHTVPLAQCYVGAQDGENEFCYGCDQNEKQKERYGLRTFKRKVVLGRCRHCWEAASLHEANAPHKCVRVPSCPGFEPEQDEGRVYVPTNLECTEWMTVDVVTGERLAYVDHRTKYDGEFKARRFHLPLLGAPGTVPSDSRDELRVKLAYDAEKVRGRIFKASDDENDEPQTKARKGRKKTK